MRHLKVTEGIRSISRGEEGQVSILVVLAVGLFLLLFVGFGVDMTNLFFHRQMAQNAADAACVAAGTDMLKQRVNGRCTTAGGTNYPCGNFTVGTPFNCAGNATAAPCQYAALNGYNGAWSFPLPPKEANSVQVNFPASVPGVVTPNPAFTGPYPFVQVDVYDNVKVYFSSLLSGIKTQQVHALAKCGLQVKDEAVPILVLDPTEPKSFQVGGNPLLQILGGPNRSIQVDSGADSANASGDAAYIGGNGKVDLTQAGPDYKGANFGVTGGPSAAPGGFQTTTPPFGWQSHVLPVGDPFATLPPPTDPGPAKLRAPNNCAIAINAYSCKVLHLQDGCPDVAGCTEYGPGDYSGNQLFISNSTALFQPGLYFLKGGTLDFHANSLVRPTDPAQAPGDGSLGAIFYLTCANPGKCTSGNVASVLITADSGKRAVDQFATVLAHCPGDTWDPKLLPGGALAIPSLVGGNVLLGPCTTDGTYPGNPLSLGIPTPQRGILMFGDRSAAPVNPEKMEGGGGLLLAGTEYFRDCPNLLTTFKCSDPPTDYQTVTYLTGGSGSGTRVFGQIITDQLTLQGNSGITMDLNPWAKPILTVELLQ